MFLQLWPVIYSVNKADDCSSQSHGREKINLRRKSSVKFWLLAPTRNPVRRLAMLKTIFRKKKKNNNNNNNSSSSSSSLSRSCHNKQGQGNHQPNCTAVCVLLTAKERAHGAPDVKWACAWCHHGISHKSKFVIKHPLCEYCVL